MMIILGSLVSASLCAYRWAYWCHEWISVRNQRFRSNGGRL